MTDSYNQDNINLRDASPITVSTVDAVTAVVVQLDVLTGNGQSLAVKLFGGGSAPVSAGNPGGVNTANYSLTTGDAIFTREAGVGLVTGPGPLVIANATGLPPIITFTFVDDAAAGTTTCQITILSAVAALYNHRLKVSKIRF